MAQPRIFISSTCYDLQEIRYQLKDFIEGFGYMPVMSEFGDVFYDYKKHIQDSCKSEIDKSQLFVLIVGNSFGSIYYKQKDNVPVPDSVTMQEFRKAIESDIYKHIFVNRFVDYDYHNYKKSLHKSLKKHLENNKIKKNEIDLEINNFIEDYNSKYQFPNDSYKFIFNFLEIIYDLKTNNAIITYESFEDIKDSLRKQWAGFMYESISKEKITSISVVEKLGDKLERIENQIKLLTTGKIDNRKDLSKITIDLTKLTDEINIGDFTKIKNDIHFSLNKLLTEEVDDIDGPYLQSRIKIEEKIDPENIKKWIKSLGEVIHNYKWAKFVSSKIVFKKIGVKYSYLKYFENIQYELVLNFYNLYLVTKENFSEEDVNGLMLVIAEKFNEYYELPKITVTDDDVPF